MTIDNQIPEAFLFLVGFSGCGKSYLAEQLIKLYPTIYTDPDYTAVQRELRIDDPDHYVTLADTVNLKPNLKFGGLRQEIVALTDFNGKVYFSAYTPERVQKYRFVTILPATPMAVLSFIQKKIFESFSNPNSQPPLIQIVVTQGDGERLVNSPRASTRDVFTENTNCFNFNNFLQTPELFDLLKKGRFEERIQILLNLVDATDPYGFSGDVIEVVHDNVIHLLSQFDYLTCKEGQ